LRGGERQPQQENQRQAKTIKLNQRSKARQEKPNKYNVTENNVTQFKSK
jgi:hypothetical protein